MSKHSSEACRYGLLLLVLLLTACQHPNVPGTPTKHKTSALIQKAGRYAWRVQLTVEYPNHKGSRTVWFKIPSAGTMPLEDLTDVSAAALYAAKGSGWLQPGGPKWHGYLNFYPDDTPPRLEIQCIERASCSCRHFGPSEFSGTHPVSHVGVWKPFPKL